MSTTCLRKKWIHKYLQQIGYSDTFRQNQRVEEKKSSESSTLILSKTELQERTDQFKILK